MNAVRLSLLQEQLEGVAEEMGVALARSAFSPNIRVRLDFSCALFGPTGELLAQAAHIPVHLGSMPDQIKLLVEKFKMRKGDLFIGNDPYEGGTHLPDITLMMPVFTEDGVCLGVVAARAHHADVGGAAPASMASQPNIYADGVRIPLLQIAREGEWERPIMSLLLANMRCPRDREGDLLAQQAACRHGAEGVLRVFQLWARKDGKVWSDGLATLLRMSSEGTKKALSSLFAQATAPGYFSDLLEIGPNAVEVRVSLSLNADSRLVADFTGSAPGVEAGFNATLPVTKAAVCYVVRCLSPQNLPLNQGFLDCIEVLAPECSIVNAAYPLAVAAGNVETSQRIVDVLFGAFHKLLPHRVPAASAGSMNNLSFGFLEPRFGVHYETSGGGAGGCPEVAGKALSGTQVHMTNTLSTPVEVLEEEFPVIVRRHEIVRGTGGAGSSPGGDGTVKEITFLQAASVTFMTTRRTTSPYGLAGGAPGCPGGQWVRSSSHGLRAVSASSTHQLERNDSITLQTPGGGGWGDVGSLGGLVEEDVEGLG